MKESKNRMQSNYRRLCASRKRRTSARLKAAQLISIHLPAASWRRRVAVARHRKLDSRDCGPCGGRRAQPSPEESSENKRGKIPLLCKIHIHCWTSSLLFQSNILGGHVVREREREIDTHIVHQNTSTNSRLCSVERPWDHKFCLTFLVY